MAISVIDDLDEAFGLGNTNDGTKFAEQLKTAASFRSQFNEGVTNLSSAHHKILLYNYSARSYLIILSMSEY